MILTSDNTLVLVHEKNINRNYNWSQTQLQKTINISRT